MATQLVDSLKSASLLPSKLIPADFNPTYNLTITYPSKSPSNGSLVRVSDVAEKPTVVFSAISSDDATSTPSLTLLLLDPDAPTPDDPKFAFWRHWVITSIPAGAREVAEGKELTRYLAPGPKDESGPHRYLFLLFKEPEGFEVGRGDVGGEEFVERRSFPAGEWVGRYGLELVGVQWMRGVGDGWVGEEDV
ncbi:hypothetical protein G6514_009361 [Epicoccum nigrum]|nr:hypothetical protein G6514_009361 [Epicoccum nigrum]